MSVSVTKPIEGCYRSGSKVQGTKAGARGMCVHNTLRSHSWPRGVPPTDEFKGISLEAQGETKDLLGVFH
jgi:hypothetical protein